MRKYLTFKNAILTMVIASIYYRSIFEGASVFQKIIGTGIIVVVLMGALGEVDKLYMENWRNGR